MKTLHTCIVSWRGRHADASRIAREVGPHSDRTTIVYSDPDPDTGPDNDHECVRRPDHLFFGDKFRACLDGFSMDALLLIHADCECDDWAGLVRSCRHALASRSSIGVWAPLIDYTGFDLPRTRVADLAHSTLSIVAHTDAIVLGMTRAVAERLQRADYERNLYGWGIGWMAVCHAYAHQMVAVVDRAIRVRHPRPRGYPSAEAGRQRDEFLQQLTAPEQIQRLLLQSHMQRMDLALSARNPPLRPPAEPPPRH